MKFYNKAWLKNLTDDWREVGQEFTDENHDFTVGNYRFIHEDSIDEVQRDELESDLHLLGCFSASFLANVLGISESSIQKMQECEAHEAIGDLVISMDKLRTLQEEYSNADGYGHHFAHYDHEEQSVGPYYVFRVQ